MAHFRSITAEFLSSNTQDFIEVSRPCVHIRRSTDS